MHHETSVALAGIVALAVVLSAAPAVAQDEDGIRYTGAVVDLAGISAGTAARFELVIEDFTSDERLAELARIAEERGQDALEDALWDDQAGWIRIDQNLGYPVAIAGSSRTEDGELVWAVTDRPLQLWEIWQDTRTRDYPFSVVELHLDEDGEGEGEIYPLARVDIRETGLIVDSYLPQALRLPKVESEQADATASAAPAADD